MKNLFSYLCETAISLQYHDEFNPKLWTDEKLDNEVRVKLLMIATAWRKFANISESSILDIIMTGGNANFNYTDKSDIDVHLVIDPKELTCDPVILKDYFMVKKALWADNHAITVRGYPVELFAHSFTEVPHKGQGVYSLLNDKWLQRPQHEGYNFANDKILMRKVEYYEKRINSVVDSKSNDTSAVQKLKNKIMSMRSAAIAEGGEFSFENLVYKELRNRGALDKLSKYVRQQRDTELSLK